MNQLGRPGDDSTVSEARQSSHVAVGLLAMEVLLKMDVVAQPGTEEPAVALTAREQQVLKLIAEGKTTKQIAFLLGISFKTTVFYRTRLMEKLNIHETASLVRYAIRHGLIQP